MVLLLWNENKSKEKNNYSRNFQNAISFSIWTVFEMGNTAYLFSEKFDEIIVVWDKYKYKLISQGWEGTYSVNTHKNCQKWECSGPRDRLQHASAQSTLSYSLTRPCQPPVIRLSCPNIPAHSHVQYAPKIPKLSTKYKSHLKVGPI